MLISDKNLRLRPVRLPEDLFIGLPWYQDKVVLHFSEGEGTLPVVMETVGNIAVLNLSYNILNGLKLKVSKKRFIFE